MPRKGWVNVAIPEDLAKIIDEVIEVKKYGYRSRQDFVIDAVRRRLEHLGYLK
jgi:metal-responsive CopG/Arc/MetJ family transcriptional regulator